MSARFCGLRCSLRPWRGLKEPGSRYFESLCHFLEHRDRRVTNTAFYAADIGAVQATFIAELLLRETDFLPVFPHIMSN